jgi:nitroimidazol reductase NimA-like FMN-containing flavoprotein (pyridoxamine 5'-phosphate oxidase superfamily)
MVIMSGKRITFETVETEVRKKSFGVLTTIDSKERPHSTGIIYAVGRPESSFALYCIVGETYAKVRNIRQNPNVSLVVTFPHYWIRMVPASYAMFRGTAEILPDNDSDGRWAMSQSRIGRMNLQTDTDEELVYIKMTPEPTVFCYGVGIGLMELRRHHESAMYKVTIPEDRR